MQFEIKQGMNQDILKTYPDNHFDSIITDPPYGIEFLGKDWDSNTGAVETWQECLRVLKPGGYLLAFSAARTYHHLATNIESVGFEIRDQIMWIYGSGFPKAQDVGKAIDKRGIDNEWAGWKTALKPAHEPIVMARKPFKGSTIDNVLTHGVGALNIDASRIGDEEITTVIKRNEENTRWYGSRADSQTLPKPIGEETNTGRFPSNVLGEIPDYQKYFYCPKVSRKERHCGFEQKNIPTTSGGMYDNHGTGKMYSIGTDMKTTKSNNYTQTGSLGRMKDAYTKGTDMKTKKHDPLGHIPTNPDGMLESSYKAGTPGQDYHDVRTNIGNNHPTVKPVELMKYLIRLVTPPNSKVLDPFTGSGSTGMAAVDLGHEFTGCELNPNYVRIAETRIAAWNDHGLGPLFE